MNDTPSPALGRLRQRTAEEIRVILARRRMSASELARRTGMKQSTMSRRLTGETAFDLDDLEVIAHALGIDVTELLHGGGTQSTVPKLQPARRPSGPASRPGDTRPNRGPKRAGPNPMTRRPAMVGPTTLQSWHRPGRKGATTPDVG